MGEVETVQINIINNTEMYSHFAIKSQYEITNTRLYQNYMKQNEKFEGSVAAYSDFIIYSTLVVFPHLLYHGLNQETPFYSAYFNPVGFLKQGFKKSQPKTKQEYAHELGKYWGVTQEGATNILTQLESRMKKSSSFEEKVYLRTETTDTWYILTGGPRFQRDNQGNVIFDINNQEPIEIDPLLCKKVSQIEFEKIFEELQKTETRRKEEIKKNEERKEKEEEERRKKDIQTVKKKLCKVLKKDKEECQINHIEKLLQSLARSPSP